MAEELKLYEWSKKKSRCPGCGEKKPMVNGHQGLRCHDCHVADPMEMLARFRHQESEIRTLQWEVEYQKREQALSLLPRADLVALLKKERARLSFLSSDLVSCDAGYDCVTVTVHNFSGERRVVRRTNVRQAVDVLAEDIYGPDWVDRILGCPNAPWRENPNEREGSGNTWFGPLSQVRDETGDWGYIPDADLKSRRKSQLEEARRLGQEELAREASE